MVVSPQVTGCFVTYVDIFFLTTSQFTQLPKFIVNDDALKRNATGITVKVQSFSKEF
jgi:hypothetical protein